MMLLLKERISTMERSLTIDEWKLSVEENLKEIRRNIEDAAKRANRDPSDVRLMAVTKTVPAEIINHAISLGVDFIGENRVQELNSKYDELNKDGLTIHLIGSLQTNKVKQVVGKVSMIESVDSLHLAEEISKQSKKIGITTDVLIEVNIGCEESKGGIKKEETEALIEKISSMDSICVCGLMTIPPFDADSEKTRHFFKEIYNLFIDIKDKNKDNSNVKMKYISMGMSSDYEIAIEEGANIVRVGSALFGARN